MTATAKTTARIASTALALALAASAGLAAVAPATALANDGMPARTQAQAQAPRASHWEGEPVTVGDDWGQPVYAEWHRGASGRWWATFWTYNYTKVYAEPAPAGCGWAFHAYDSKGDFVTIYRCEESSTHGIYGPQGVSSHWCSADGSAWF